MNGKPLEEIAAFQWESTNRIIMDDLLKLPRGRWLSVGYADLTANTRSTVEGLCDFAGIDLDASIIDRISKPLPLSRFTQTPPAADKWRINAAAIERIMPGVESTWKRIQTFC